MMEGDLHNIKVPTILIMGRKDKLVTIDNVKFIEQYFENSDLFVDVLEDKGHFILWSDMDIIQRRIEDMVRAVF